MGSLSIISPGGFSVPLPDEPPLLRYSDRMNVVTRYFEWVDEANTTVL